MSDDDRSDDERDVKEGDDVASDSVWQTTDIRNSKPTWSAFQGSNLISSGDKEKLEKLNREPLASQGAVFCEDASAFAKAFMAVLSKVTNEQAARWVTTTLDELCKENREIARLFKGLAGTEHDPIEVLSQVLLRDKDEILKARTYNCLAHIFNAGMSASAGTTKNLMDHVRLALKDEKRKPFVTLSTLALLQGLLREHTRRVAFVESKGVDMLVSMTRSPEGSSKNQASNTQLMYQCAACLWLLSYSPGVQLLRYPDGVQEKLVNMEMVAMLVQVVKGTMKEKVIRMMLAIMVNLIDTGDMKSLLSVCGGLRILESLKQRQWTDEDITSDLETLTTKIGQTLTTKIGQNVEQSSTFDEYRKELMSADLQWTAMHKSPTFWEKNCHKFLEKDQEVIKFLVALINPSGNTKSKCLSVALHDMGEFVRYHPAGKATIVKMGAKMYIMHHLVSEDADVSKEALSCVQKLMVN